MLAENVVSRLMLEPLPRPVLPSAPMNPTLGFYDSHAEEATASYERVDFSRLVDRFAATLGASVRVLDLGCGSGRDAARMLARGYDVVTADGSEAMLAEATALHPELAGRTARVVLPGPLPFERDAFDGAMSWAVIMHVAEPELAGVFGELARVVRPGGVLGYSVNTERAGLDADGTDARGRHFTCLPAAGWERLHEAAGFTTMEREETDDITGRSGIRWVSFFARRV